MTDHYLEVVDPESLQRRISELGAVITADYDGLNPVLVGVMNGAIPFLADLIRRLRISHEVDFLLLTRFGEKGRVSLAMDTAISLENRHVLIVEDIVDTGLTLSTLLRNLEVRRPASLRTVSLLDKVARRIVEVPVEYRGFEIGDEFLLGYGLDWEGRYRNLPGLWAVMDMERLQDLHETFPAVVFGGYASR
ncbi:MAG: hypoxanthine phosphoribosyltransferase [Acidimicrobiia bacterium]